MHVAPLAVAFAALFASASIAQRVELPGGTGTLTPPTGWVVLSRAALDASERATDPTAEPARTIVQNIVASLRANGSTADHMVLHAAGKDGAVRLVDAYRGPGGATAADLRGENMIAGLRGAFVEALQKNGATATFVGAEFPALWQTGGLRLRYDVRSGALQYTIDEHVVPAGASLQFFEAVHFPGDPDATAAIDALLRTFDGAIDPPRQSLTHAALLGAVSGAAGGLIVWFMRRRRSAARRR